ncbi:Uncharacterised protein [Alistipes sp. cv1]|nr:Uncharacterised protein [Faecalibacterium prausnitzii]
MYDKSRDKSHFIFALFFFWSANFRPQNVPRNILHHCNGLNIRNIEYFSIFCIVMYKENQSLNEIRGRALQSIAGHDRQYYQIVQPDPTRAKVIGETVHP